MILLILQFLNMDYNRGNFVITPDGVQEIDSANETIIECNGKFYLYDEIDSIPLSVEWLKKAGYKQLKRVEKTYSLGNFEDNSAIYFTGVRFIHIKTNVHIEWVHELQQLHSVLFKEELKFNL